MNPYLRTKILTANPEELRLMLYDGAIKFCRQALDALPRKDFEKTYQSLVRAQKIVLELSTSLNHEADADLCQKLSALYNYIYRRLVDANMERDTAAVSEAIELLEYERETWVLLMGKLKEARENGEDPVAQAAAELAERQAAPGNGQPDAAANESAESTVGRIGPNGYTRPTGTDAGPGPGFSAEG